MTHQQKVAYFKQLLQERGYWRSNAIPPACQLLWLLGLETPPPYFLPFWTGVMVSGISFGLSMGIAHSIFQIIIGTMPTLLSSIGFTIVSGLPFGLMMATFWRMQARKLRLPNWHHFPARNN
jgi:hypothetical protein